MSNGVFGIGVSGLTAAQAGLVTTGHNITNANTQGYHRQIVQQSATTPLVSGGGFFGQGVQIDTVVRAYSQFLDTQLTQAQAQASAYSMYHAQLSQIDNVVADKTAGLSSAVQDFFAAAQAVATNPANVPSRQALLSSGAALTARFNGLAARFDDLRNGVNLQLTSSIGEVNSYAQQLAALNGKILVAQQNPNQPPNDLLDQRDALVGKLNALVGATATPQNDGTVNVFIGNGQNLVVGGQAMTLVATPSVDDPHRLGVGYNVGSGIAILNESLLQSGSIGGLLAFRANELDSAQNALGRIALGIAQTFNDQHRLGQDLTGALGGVFFASPAPTVISQSTNTSGAVVTASVVETGALTTSDYRLSYDGTNYTITRLSDNTMTKYATLPQTFDGVTVAVTSGVVASGESFLIQPTRNAARNIAMALSDPAKIAAAAPVRTAAVSGNIGAANVSAGSVNSFNDKVVITFSSATAFDAVDSMTGAVLAKNMTYSAGSNISFNGWTIQIAGAPVTGDIFTVDHTYTAATSAMATIGSATLNTPSPVDPFLTNGIKVVFDSNVAFHLEGTTNNVSGPSLITGGAFVPALPLAAGANPGIVVTNGTATIGTSGAGAYASTGAQVTISGGTVNVVGVPGIATISGATVTVEGGSYNGSTTFKGVDILIDNATGDISIPAASAASTASTFHGRPATGIVYNGAISNLVSVNGWTTALTGIPVAGDIFTVTSNSGGVADGRNGLLLAGLQMQNTLAAGTASYQGAYSQMVSMVGNKTRQLDIQTQAQNALVDQSMRVQQSMSGVDLDEEAANLLRYQQAYQASGKMIQIASTLFQTVLDLSR